MTDDDAAPDLAPDNNVTSIARDPAVDATREIAAAMAAEGDNVIRLRDRRINRIIDRAFKRLRENVGKPDVQLAAVTVAAQALRGFGDAGIEPREPCEGAGGTRQGSAPRNRPHEGRPGARRRGGIRSAWRRP
jgi:hypothetical protein